MSHVPEKLSPLDILNAEGQVLEAKIPSAKRVLGNIDQPGFFEKGKEKRFLRLDVEIQAEDPAQFIDNVLRVGLIKKTLKNVAIPAFSGDLIENQTEITRLVLPPVDPRPVERVRLVEFPKADNLAELGFGEKVLYGPLSEAGMEGSPLTKEELDRRAFGPHPSHGQKDASAHNIVTLRRKLPARNLDIPLGLIDPENQQELYMLAWKDLSKVSVITEAIEEVVPTSDGDSGISSSVLEFFGRKLPSPTIDSAVTLGAEPLLEDEEQKRADERKLRQYKTAIWSIFDEINGRSIVVKMNGRQLMNAARQIMNRNINPAEITLWADHGILTIPKRTNVQTWIFEWQDLARIIYCKRGVSVVVDPHDLDLFRQASSVSSLQEWKEAMRKGDS
ncbi:hypothetical protein A3J13_01115 [Candidatus Daviesbacteria bacterium RIFCSPLOWO2_02_FULL_36_8]|uniref:Uncharacterized protein n=1 Tax=Candidatus Daviesbacteria bacterium RIFCSPLOWO2_02_FULL_36_8 TaxID=1797793 RepID=A0A1F5MFF6_9BACT|nr:MAG: hypothetical protein A3J13_01115 [Candidatus Daviesbacteria bacterium RIFCSPLOWO2_02_FULL_36_8]